MSLISGYPPKKVGICEEDMQMLGGSLPDDKFAMITEEAINRRQIHIMDPISDVTFEQVKNLYDDLIEDDLNKPIHFIIGTVGGDVKSMLGIMNLILLSPVPCYTYLMGETCSAGSWIYLAGHKRFAPKTSLVSFMLHPMEWNSTDSLGNHSSGNAYVGKISKALADFSIKRTTLSKQQLSKLSTTETRYFVGEELFTFGIATDVLETSIFWFSGKKKEKKSRVINLTETKKGIE